MKKFTHLIILTLGAIALSIQPAFAQDVFNLQVVPAQITTELNTTIQFSTNSSAHCFIKFGPTSYSAQTGYYNSNYNPTSDSYITDNNRKVFTATYSNLAPNSDYYYSIVCENGSKSLYSDVYKIDGNYDPHLDLDITPTYTRFLSSDSAELKFSTRYLADCTVAYDPTNPDNVVSQNAHLSELADQTDDNKFYYTKTFTNLTQNIEYLYKINCTYNSKEFSKNFSYHHHHQVEHKDLIISDIEGNFRDTAYEVIYSTNEPAECGVKLSESPFTLENTPVMESMNVNPPPNAPTNETKKYHMSWWYNLSDQQDYYFKIICSYNNENVETPMYLLTNHDQYVSQYPESWIDNKVTKPQPKQKVVTDATNNLGEKHRGKLFLQVEDKGRIWYVNPADARRHEVTFANALRLFEELAIGISNTDLNKIPISLQNIPDNQDSDGDGYLDRQEIQSGHNPYGPGKLSINQNFANKHKGKLFLQVQDGGRIWYVDFDGQRHEVTWDNLLPLFESLAVGITNADLQKISSVEYK